MILPLISRFVPGLSGLSMAMRLPVEWASSRRRSPDVTDQTLARLVLLLGTSIQLRYTGRAR
jgi:hypothetical protein